MPHSVLFCDRNSAGVQLAEAIEAEINLVRASGVSVSPVVYALPRGGLPVAVPVALKLGCPLEIITAKKIARPEDPELAIGAVTADGLVIWSSRLHDIKSDPSLNLALQEAKAKAEAQWQQFAPYCSNVSAEGTIAILIDDGIATGMTIAVAILSLRLKRPAAVWVATPVAPLALMKMLQEWCDRAIVLAQPENFLSVSRFYEEFPQLETEEAIVYLQKVNHSSEQGKSSLTSNP
ncbi:phosphoribosyltransferase [Aerosakkonemataceae cyanobacterium BLCC-F154]|uniref:Phosphoribosyltransferase n=1 Tax=Floridaenema fluviatile BLCC-F154 TaxID=3153640 RepID=A0ABV4YAB8_9CYAN